MADKNIAVRHVQRNDTRANWLSTNPILSKGELGIESDTFKIKIGNGVDNYASLPYFGGSTISKIETRKAVATLDGQTAFEIPFEDYEQDKCYLDVKINSVWINPDKYTINGRILTLKSGRNKGTEIFFTCHYLQSHASDDVNKIEHTHTVSEITDFPEFPTSLPANGGNSATVGGLAPSAFAPAEHHHDNKYSLTTHTHNYSASNHNHDGTYATASHNHNGTYATASHTHDDRYYTESEMNTKLDAKPNKTGRYDLIAGAIQSKDVRSDNQPPSWYYTNYPKSTVVEFKSCASLGLPSGSPNYCHCETHVPWTDSSGGYPTQIAWRDRQSPMIRYGSSTSAWGAWTSLGGGGVKSVQRGYINNQGASSKDANDISCLNVAISSVNMSKTVVFINGRSMYNASITSSSSNDYYTAIGRLTSSTNLQITFNYYQDSGSPTARVRNVDWQVVEYA